MKKLLIAGLLILASLGLVSAVEAANWGSKAPKPTGSSWSTKVPKTAFGGHYVMNPSDFALGQPA